jgi:hypothetical protein
MALRSPVLQGTITVAFSTFHGSYLSLNLTGQFNYLPVQGLEQYVLEAGAVRTIPIFAFLDMGAFFAR